MSTNVFIIISFGAFLFIFIRKFWPSIIETLDQYIADIKKNVFQKEASIKEHEKLKEAHQKRLQHLHSEIKELQTTAQKKLNFLKANLNEELEMQYSYNQKSFQKIIQRMQKQQKRALQIRCSEEILAQVKEEIKKKTSFEEEYMVSLLNTSL